MIAIAVAVASGTAGCAADLARQQCQIQCGQGDVCPSGMRCGIDDFCHTDGDNGASCLVRGDGGLPLDDAGDGDDAGERPDGGLTVCQRAAQVPDNDDCASALDLTEAAAAEGGVEVAGDIRMYSDIGTDTSCVAARSGPDAVYDFTLELGEEVTVTVTPASPNMNVSIWVGLLGCGEPLLCFGVDDSGPGGSETLSYDTEEVEDVQFIVDSGPGGGCFTLHAELIELL